jgi:RNA polymerase sigma factor (sigma-70 family)
LLRLALGTAAVSDRDLLARFVASRDEDAFAEIVRRHGPMVLAACRRVTGRAHDAEDAFQAAFLVLARRAGHVGRPELLANWLYGVAYRTALEARAARRRIEDRAVPAAPEPAAPPPPDDTTELRRVVDEELARLPDKYRTAVVLCDLEGLARAAAAAQLGIPEGTLSSRLAHARKVLADRLARRGVTATAAAVAAALGGDTSAVVLPNTLANVTVSAAVRFAPGGVAPLGVSPAVSSLTDGVLKIMLVTRLRQLFAVGLLACGLTGAGIAVAQQFPFQNTIEYRVPINNQPGADPFAPEAQPNPQPKPPEQKKYVAKGVEDDDVPYGAFPEQAVVRVEDGKLIVRQRVQMFTAGYEKRGEVMVAKVDRRSEVQSRTFDPADIAVFDMKGNRLSPKAWREMFKSDVHVLVGHDGKLPNPRELTLFKADTLLVVLPAQADAVEVPAAPGRAGYRLRQYYEPLTNPYPPATPPVPGPNPFREMIPAPGAAPPTPPPGGTTLPVPATPPAPAPGGAPTTPQPAPETAPENVAPRTE